MLILTIIVFAGLAGAVCQDPVNTALEQNGADAISFCSSLLNLPPPVAVTQSKSTTTSTSTVIKTTRVTYTVVSTGVRTSVVQEIETASATVTKTSYVTKPTTTTVGTVVLNHLTVTSYSIVPATGTVTITPFSTVFTTTTVLTTSYDIDTDFDTETDDTTSFATFESTVTETTTDTEYAQTVFETPMTTTTVTAAPITATLVTIQTITNTKKQPKQTVTITQTITEYSGLRKRAPWPSYLSAFDSTQVSSACLCSSYLSTIAIAAATRTLMTTSSVTFTTSKTSIALETILITSTKTVMPQTLIKTSIFSQPTFTYTKVTTAQTTLTVNVITTAPIKIKTAKVVRVTSIVTETLTNTNSLTATITITTWLSQNATVTLIETDAETIYETELSTMTVTDTDETQIFTMTSQPTTTETQTTHITTKFTTAPLSYTTTTTTLTTATGPVPSNMLANPGFELVGSYWNPEGSGLGNIQCGWTSKFSHSGQYSGIFNMTLNGLGSTPNPASCSLTSGAYVADGTYYVGGWIWWDGSPYINCDWIFGLVGQQWVYYSLLGGSQQRQWFHLSITEPYDSNGAQQPFIFSIYCSAEGSNVPQNTVVYFDDLELWQV